MHATLQALQARNLQRIVAAEMSLEYPGVSVLPFKYASYRIALWVSGTFCHGPGHGGQPVQS